MKNFAVAYHTDIGIKKQTNQDSLLIKGIGDRQNEILFAALCDGMGGMTRGELASATVIREFSNWFLQVYVEKGLQWGTEEVRAQWQRLLVQVNEKLMRYGQQMGLQLGTTATAILLLPEGRYQLCHIGDTRIYRIAEKIEQLTEDHTFIAREIRRGKMTAEQAKLDSRRNVLLQCIGVNEYLEPQFQEGVLGNEEVVLLCSDGFRHEITEWEIFDNLRGKSIGWDEEVMREQLVRLVELNKQRQETDNISAILIRIK